MRARTGESQASVDRNLAAATAEIAALRARQSATARVLQAIATAPAEVDRALRMIAESACSLCSAYDAVVLLKRKDALVFGAHHGPIPVDFFEFPVTPGWTAGRSVIEGRPVQVHDLLASADEFPEGAEMARRLGHRTTLSVPMLSGGEAIGSITLRRFEVRPFSDDELALLTTFADQAVIAIQNARMVGELDEALQQQTATTEVLKAISRSIFDLPAVLATLLEAAVHVCESDQGTIAREKNGAFFRVSSHGFSPEFLAAVLDRPVGVDVRSASGRALAERRVIHIPDVLLDANYDFPEALQHGGFRAIVGVPLLRGGSPIGVLTISRKEARPFTEKQLGLLATFADQAAIAIENARLLEAVQARTRELQETLEQQTAASEILRAISTSMTDAQPVFEVIVRNAVSLCGSLFANVFLFDGERLHYAASHNVEPGYAELLRTKYPMRPDRSQISGRVIIAKAVVRLEDALADPDYDKRFPSSMRWRRMLGVPMLNQGEPVGVIVVGWAEAGPILARQEELLKTFADQALVAIENARLFAELGAKNRDLTQALERQTATSAILRVIASSPTDLGPVLDAVAENAARLCGAADAQIFRAQGDMLRLEASFGTIPIHFREEKIGRGWVTGRAVVDRRTIHVHDLSAEPEHEFPVGREMQRQHGHRTTLATPLLKQGVALGAILIRRMEVHPFSEEQIRLLETFADQASIAIDNARLFEALQSALAEFNAVLENIDYGVLFMDQDLRARIINPALRRLWDIPQEVLDRRPTLRELLEYNRERGVYTVPPERWEEWADARTERIRQGSIPPGEFVRADGKVYIYQCVALPDGGRMLSYFDITELKNRQVELMSAKEAAETALAELRAAQERLVQTEKLASLGQLTAGIAHEIKNPLNFVNNFAALSADLLVELEAVLAAPIAALAAAERADAEDLLRTVRENLGKIVHHGRRADSIVRNMLLHARQGSGEWRAADVNAIAEEALNLAYHGARASHPGFNVEIVRHLDPAAGAVECCPQDVMRVVLNLVSNGIYAANKKRPSAPAGFVPRIELTTRAEGDGVAIEVRDNGTGIPAEIRDRIFLPFFTTKPAGEGTGLGLSLSHDIVVEQHGGSFAVETEPGAFTAFRIVLPRKPLTGAGAKT